ncbi:MAG: class I SAM-dependent rRNA methyltransferase [Akkermansiaceae bacterium]|nr:class I SAM-dependent rRNA methyltransferase [Akkermansiaceae bacterium]
MGGLIIAPKARLFHGHDWVYGTEVRAVYGSPQPGDVVSLKDQRDRFLGSAIYNPQSQIIARRFSRRKQELDADFFLRRISQALDLRLRRLPGEELCRLVWSESDGLPGLVVDRYKDVLVVQALTLAMRRHLDHVVAALRELLAPACILLRNDSPMLVAEGLEPESSVLYGQLPPPFVASGRGTQFLVDPTQGQKTGLYLDQMDNYQAVARLAKGRRVLDCFSNQGGFALACAMAGAQSVTAVDISDTAIRSVRSNAELNGVSVETVVENAFDFLKRESDAVRNGAAPKWDLIILDPPSFTRNRKSVNGALRGYKEIHLRAMQMLPVGGILSTFCCSHHISTPLFHGIVAEAAVDGHSTLRLVATHGQSADHPVLLNIPETEYLKGATYELVPGR